MALRLRNRWKYKGGDRWHWEAFVDDDGSGELQQVDYVKYVLHPTFPDPMRRVDDPAHGFVLSASGWGTFTLKAFVHTKDGKKRKLTHEIELRHDPTEGTSK